MIFWNDYSPHNIIEDVDLEEIAKKNNTILNTSDSLEEEVKDWFNYAHVVAVENNFNVIYHTCFIYYVTMYFADCGISAGAEEEYFKKKMGDVVMEMYLDSVKLFDELEQKRTFFNKLLEFFKGDEIEKYERHVFQHNIRTTQEIKDWFDKQGVTRNIIRSLMDGTIEKPNLNANEKSTTNIVFLLNYSEETRWMELSRFGDPDRLRVLLYDR